MSLLLVVTAGLFIRTFASLSSVSLGFDPGGVVVINVNTRRAGVPSQDRQALFRELVERVSAVPGVAAAAASVTTPIGGNGLLDVVNRQGEPRTTELFEGPGRPGPRTALAWVAELSWSRPWW